MMLAVMKAIYAIVYIEAWKSQDLTGFERVTSNTGAML